MKMIQIYDKPTCCPSGVCGPSVDPTLPRFAADLEWLKLQGHTVERYNLAQNPLAFTKTPTIHHLLDTEGINCLPLIVINAQLVSKGVYPPRETLRLWAEDAVHPANTASPSTCYIKSSDQDCELN